jgi:transcriptional regulator with XRE-family HTH domain
MEAGLSQVELSEIIGVTMGAYNALENMRTDPLKRDGELRNITAKLLNYYSCEFEDLWPEIVRQVAVPIAVREVDADELQQLLPQHETALLQSPEDLYEKNKDLEDIHSAMEVLTERERDAVLAESRDQTNREVAKKYGISPARMAIVRDQALRRVKRLVNAKRNKPYASRREQNLASLVLECLEHSRDSCREMGFTGHYPLTTGEISETIAGGVTTSMVRRVLQLMEQRNQVERVPNNRWKLVADLI